MHGHSDHGRGGAECSGCRGCPVQERLLEDGPAGEGNDDLALSGWGLGGCSVGLFLGPGVLAIAGAVCCGEGQGARLAGATVGLLLGMTGSVVFARLRGRVGGAESPKKTVRPQ